MCVVEKIDWKMLWSHTSVKALIMTLGNFLVSLVLHFLIWKCRGWFSLDRVVEFYRVDVSRAPNNVWWESGWFLLSFLLIMLSFLLLCAKYSSNAVITVISIFTVVLLYYLNFLRMSDTLATISFSSQKNPMRREIRVGIIILSIDKEMEAQGACDWSRLVSDRISPIA